MLFNTPSNLGVTQKKGCACLQGIHGFCSHQPFDIQFGKIVKFFLLYAIKNIDLAEIDNIIILDDGGMLIKEANRLKAVSNIRAIEQTSSGYNYIQHLALRFPVIDVARSKAKLEMESKFVGDNVCKCLRYLLQKIRLKSPKILVVGLGPVGRSILETLKEEFYAVGLDQDPQKTEIYLKNKKMLADFDVIIGATGNKILNIKHGADLGNELF
jgi:S-adenosylhomocysteine hydrolase